jgi:hypothetical protein
MRQYRESEHGNSIDNPRILSLVIPGVRFSRRLGVLAANIQNKK